MLSVIVLDMSDNLTIRPWPDQRALPDNEYWQIAREIKKQEAVYPQQSRATIKTAVELAFTQGGHRSDPQLIDRYVAMYLTSASQTPSASRVIGNPPAAD